MWLSQCEDICIFFSQYNLVYKTNLPVQIINWFSLKPSTHTRISCFFLPMNKIRVMPTERIQMKPILHLEIVYTPETKQK